jgi:DegV family protein with EDD domain
MRSPLNVRIVTDSTCDLPAHLLDEYQISVIPLLITVGSHSYQDGVDLSRQQFYETIISQQPPPATAVPDPHVFQEVYETLVAHGATHILSIHAPISLTPTMNVASLGAQTLPPGQVTVFDSRQVSLGLGFQVLKAANAASQGSNIDEIMDILDKQISRTQLTLVVEHLDYLQRSQRLSLILDNLDTINSDLVMIDMYDGNLTVHPIAENQSVETHLLTDLKKWEQIERLALIHTRSLDRVRAFQQRVSASYPQMQITISEISPLIGAHIGPGALGFVCLTHQDT